MEQAAEFAMSGEENRDLGLAYWELMADRDKSVEAFGKALSDLNDKGQLLELGGFIAAKVGAEGRAEDELGWRAPEARRGRDHRHW